jgi:hypothetical protein
LAVNGLVENSIDDIAVETAIAIESNKSGMGKKPKVLQVVRGAQYEIYVDLAESASFG